MSDLTPRPGAADKPTPPRQPLRISDSERGQATALLGEHYAQGRLDLDEFDDRSTLAMAARHQHQLDALLADLPSFDAVPPSPPQVPDGSSHRCWTKPPPLVLVPLAIAIVILTYGGALLALPLLWWAATARQRTSRFGSAILVPRHSHGANRGSG